MVARCTALVSLLARRHCHLCATATFICKYRLYIIFLWLGQYLIGEESVGMGSRYPSTRHRRHGRAGCSSPCSCSKTCSPSIHTRLCVYARTHVNLFHSTTGMKNNKNTECESLQIPQEYFRRRSGIYDGKKLFSPTLCLHSVCFGGLYIQYPIQYPCGVLNDSGITVNRIHLPHVSMYTQLPFPFFGCHMLALYTRSCTRSTHHTPVSGVGVRVWGIQYSAFSQLSLKSRELKGT